MSLFQNIKNPFTNFSPPVVKFAYNHFIDEDVKSFFAENGYVVIKNVVSDNSISIIQNTFERLKNHIDYYEVDGFITSANYGFDAQRIIHEDLKKVNQDILPKIFHVGKIYYDLLNVLVIKFNKDQKEFYAHQDIPLVDEMLAPTLFAWIPTTDINEYNGALMVLPKSHKWFRWQRTHDQSESPLKNLRDEILKYMIPLYISKGDLILFDNSLVHASAPNKTSETRVAMNTGIAPNSFPLIHYQRIPENNKEIERFAIDESFWLEGHFCNPNSVPNKYQPSEIEKIRYYNKISKSNFLKIINSRN